jgi:hypothetical protein
LAGTVQFESETNSSIEKRAAKSKWDTAVKLKLLVLVLLALAIATILLGRNDKPTTAVAHPKETILDYPY